MLPFRSRLIMPSQLVKFASWIPIFVLKMTGDQVQSSYPLISFLWKNTVSGVSLFPSCSMNKFLFIGYAASLLLHPLASAHTFRCICRIVKNDN